MNYDEFQERLKLEIQESLSRQITFMESVVNKTNEMLEALIIKLDNQIFTQNINPKKLYQDYQNGVPFSRIADFVSSSILMETPKLPELTIENAEKCISFSLLNKDKNKQLLKDCPYKEIGDLVAVPIWHTDEVSFIVNNNVMQKLKLTKEEVLNIAQRNTESANYVCNRLDDLVRNILLDNGVDESVIAEILPMGPSHLHIISNPQRLDGSCSILSDSFMQKTAEQIGTDELYLLPSSRHEMLVIDSHIISDTSSLKAMVTDTNSDPNIIPEEDFLSNSIYKYDAKTHTISVCDSKGLFHDKEPLKNAKTNISRGGRGKC